MKTVSESFFETSLCRAAAKRLLKTNAKLQRYDIHYIESGINAEKCCLKTKNNSPKEAVITLG